MSGRRRRPELEAQEEEWIWGNNRGGGGAPLRDMEGNTVSNLKKVLTGNVAVDYSPGKSPTQAPYVDSSNYNNYQNQNQQYGNNNQYNNNNNQYGPDGDGSRRNRGGESGSNGGGVNIPGLENHYNNRNINNNNINSNNQYNNSNSNNQYHNNHHNGPMDNNNYSHINNQRNNQLNSPNPIQGSNYNPSPNRPGNSVVRGAITNPNYNELPAERARKLKKNQEFQAALNEQIEESKRKKAEEKARLEAEKQKELDSYLKFHYKGQVPAHVQAQSNKNPPPNPVKGLELDFSHMNSGNNSNGRVENSPRSNLYNNYQNQNEQYGNNNQYNNNNNQYGPDGDGSRRNRGGESGSNGGGVNIPGLENHYNNRNINNNNINSNNQYNNSNSNNQYHNNHHNGPMDNNNHNNHQNGSIMNLLKGDSHAQTRAPGDHCPNPNNGSSVSQRDYDELSKLCERLLSKQEMLEGEIEKQADIIGSLQNNKGGARARVDNKIGGKPTASNRKVMNTHSNPTVSRQARSQSHQSVVKRRGNGDETSGRPLSADLHGNQASNSSYPSSENRKPQAPSVDLRKKGIESVKRPRMQAVGSVGGPRGAKAVVAFGGRASVLPAPGDSAKKKNLAKDNHNDHRRAQLRRNEAKQHSNNDSPAKQGGGGLMSLMKKGKGNGPVVVSYEDSGSGDLGGVSSNIPVRGDVIDGDELDQLLVKARNMRKN